MLHKQYKHLSIVGNHSFSYEVKERERERIRERFRCMPFILNDRLTTMDISNIIYFNYLTVISAITQSNLLNILQLFSQDIIF